MTDKPECRKFGSIAYGVAFAFIIAGVALYQIALRDRVPTLYIGDGWFDLGKMLGGATAGAFAGLIGGVLGICIERTVRR